jgi:Homeodomain-like domain
LKRLEDAPRSGRPIKTNETQRVKITALACSEAPTGHARWRLRFLAEKVVELGYIERISHIQVGKILMKNELKPHLNKIWRIGKIDAQFIAQMERMLRLYALPCDPDYPVVRFYERPCFLIGTEGDPLPLQNGQVRSAGFSVHNDRNSQKVAWIPL